MLYHHVQQKPSEEEIGRSEKPGLDQRSLILDKETVHQQLADAGSKLSGQGDKENSEKAGRETVGRPLLGEIGTEVKEEKTKIQEQEIEQEQVNEELATGHFLSRHGQDEMYVEDGQRESLRHQPDLTDLEKEVRNRKADRTQEKVEGGHNYKQGPSILVDGKGGKEVPSIVREEEEGGYNHNQQDSSILGTIEPEQVGKPIASTINLEVLVQAKV